MRLSSEQVFILTYTLRRAPGGLYCGDSEWMQDLVRKGYMQPVGRKSGDPGEYFELTERGEKVARGLSVTQDPRYMS